jgi:S-DNA-T family DNA segregation ATPase FtsK/SpoIIIE
MTAAAVWLRCGVNAFRSDEPPLTLPPTAAPGAPPGFPLVATIAPLAAAGVMWALTQSPFALMFAALSPVIALAGVADGRRQSRRARRRAAKERAAAIEQLTARVRDRQERELLDRRALTPSATVVMSDAGRAGRWTSDAGRFATVSPGFGTVPSAIRVGGEPQDDDERELLEQSAYLADAPIEVDATGGIGLIGSQALTRSMARALVVQLVHAFPPDLLAVAAVPPVGWDWARALPHWSADGSEHNTVRVVEARAPGVPASGLPAHTSGSRTALIVLAESLDELTLPCRVIVRLDTPRRARLIAAPNLSAPNLSRAPMPEFVPELISGQQASLYAGLLAQHAQASGLMRAGAVMPDAIGFGELEHGPVPDSARSLTATLGVGPDGPLTLDLVADGPHAVVAGTTGSGKSELLTTWIAALAATYTPQSVGFLLVDFKGGSAFAPLIGLPHCLGVITDLGPAEAERALRSLKAELRRRERMLADWGVRSIAESGGRLGRLVIVVDEFAAMLDGFPELHALFVDIAARGRSLGVHTILCTQRPAGVVRDALLANCALRISLRVHDALDSIAVVGTDAAAKLPAARPGRCVIASAGVIATAQIAVTSREHIDAIVLECSRSQAIPQRRPWLDPLPELISLESVSPPEHGSAVVAVEDVPDEQRQNVATWRGDDGHLLITGVHGSGKTTAVQTIARQHEANSIIVDGPERLWDTLMNVLGNGNGPAITHVNDLSHPSASGQHRTLVIDDLDALIARMPSEYQDATVEALARVLREGPRRAVSVVATVQRMTPLLRSCGSLFSSTLLLEQNDKHEYALAGGPSELSDARRRPGSGVWRGHRVQIVSTGLVSAGRPVQANEPERVPDVDLAAGRTLLVSRAAPMRARELREFNPAVAVVEIDAAVTPQTLASITQSTESLDVSDRTAPPASVVLAADPATWQSAWQVFAALRPGSTIVFDDCTVADVRALLNTRQLPPMIDGQDRVWVVDQEGRLSRARLNVRSGLGAGQRVGQTAS